MRKEDILAKSRNTRDEREQIVELHSFGFGGCVVATLVVVFSIWTAYRGGQFFDYSAILFGYLSASLLYTFKNTKNKITLLVGCFAAIVAVLNTVMFFIQG
jgi:hypothetical protein